VGKLRRAGFGAYAGALCIDVGLLHLEIGQPIDGLLTRNRFYCAPVKYRQPVNHQDLASILLRENWVCGQLMLERFS
jgi:hypothetical protein